MKLQEHEKKMIRLAAVAAVVFALLNWVVLPWGEELMESRDQLTLAEKKLRRQKELVAAAPRVKLELAALEQRLAEEEKRLLPPGDASQAGAQLQQWLAQQAAGLRLEVQRSDFLPPAPVADAYVRVPVRLEFTGPVTQVMQFLNAVTRGDRAVSVDELQVSSLGVEKEKRVRCTLVVSGLMPKAS